jgi:hypothetical protein
MDQRRIKPAGSNRCGSIFHISLTGHADHRSLVLANGNVGKLLRNGRAVGYLAKNYQELLFEFQKSLI